MPRRLLASAAVALVAVLSLSAAPVAAQSDSDPTAPTAPVSEEDSPLGDIVPRPNSGQAPDSPNDPGGWQQYLVFALIVGGMAAIALLVRRSSKKALAARGDRTETTTLGDSRHGTPAEH